MTPNPRKSGRAVWLFGVMVLGAACSGTPAAPAGAPASTIPAGTEDVAVDTLLQESHSGVAEQSRLLVRSTAGLDSLYAAVYANRTPKPAPPTIDFSREVVVAASMGQRPTGGFSIEVQRVARSGDTLYVQVLETSPGASCIVTQAVTAPVEAVRVPAPQARILVPVERSAVHECG